MGPKEQGRAKTGKSNGRISQRTDSVKRKGAQGTWNTAVTPPPIRDGRDAGVYTRPRRIPQLSPGGVDSRGFKLQKGSVVKDIKPRLKHLTGTKYPVGTFTGGK
eukprot:5834621-Pleurochrysis_carterae.AAC.1